MCKSPLPSSSTLVLALALAACSEGPGRTPSVDRSATAPDADRIEAMAPVLGELVRAASVCGLTISATARDRAARIEAAALELAMRQGGTRARDRYLRSVQPPPFAARRQSQDRSRYCGEKRPAVERVDGFLSGSDGAALAQRAGAISEGR